MWMSLCLALALLTGTVAVAAQQDQPKAEKSKKGGKKKGGEKRKAEEPKAQKK